MINMSVSIGLNPNPPSVAEFGSIGNIVSLTETNIVSHTVSSGKVYYLTAAFGTGSSEARFFLYKNGEKIDEFRMHAGERNYVRVFNSPLIFDSGTVYLKAEHQNIMSQSFVGALIGYEL